VGGVRQIPDAVDTVVCAPDDGCKYHPKHAEQFPDINKLCNFASCWIYGYIGILLGARPILHISRIKVNKKELLAVPPQQTHHIQTNTKTSKDIHTVINSGVAPSKAI
jgi:hypothetical protein